MEEFEHKALALEGKGGIVARTLIAQESMGAVDFKPLKVDAGFVETRLDFIATFERYVRVLSSPDVEEFPLDLVRPRERVIVFAGAE